MRAAVVGHCEWVEFLRVDRVPAAGEIAHAGETWEEAAGGGPGAAVQLARLAGGAALFTALGADELGDRTRDELTALGVRVEAARRDEPTRRAVTFVDPDGERTITVIGSRLDPRGADALPWGDLVGADAVYLTAGDAEAVRLARRARVLVATARALSVLRDAAVELDALVGSAVDAGEAYDDDLDPPPRLVVRTNGSAGGTLQPRGERPQRYDAVPLPGPLVDRYGAGDSFAAALTFGLGQGWPVAAAVELAARCGAAVLTGRGPFSGQLRLSGPA